MVRNASLCEIDNPKLKTTIYMILVPPSYKMNLDFILLVTTCETHRGQCLGIEGCSGSAALDPRKNLCVAQPCVSETGGKAGIIV